MSQGNNIGWGAIYTRSYWGNGVKDNTISWGKYYREDATDTELVSRFVSRVEADGATVSSSKAVAVAPAPARSLGQLPASRSAWILELARSMLAMEVETMASASLVKFHTAQLETLDSEAQKTSSLTGWL